MAFFKDYSGSIFLFGDHPPPGYHPPMATDMIVQMVVLACLAVAVGLYLFFYRQGVQGVAGQAFQPAGPGNSNGGRLESLLHKNA